MSIDKELCKVINTELREALNIIAKKHGMTLEFKMGGRFDELSFSPSKISFLMSNNTTSEVSETANPKFINDYKNLCCLYNCEKEWLGKTFELNGNIYKVVGLNTKNRKNCVILENLTTGKGSKCTPDLVRHNM